LINKESNLKFLVALLNSKLMSYWFQKVFILTDKLFPYIRQSQLAFLPIKKTNTSIIRDIEVFVDQILANTKSVDYLQNPDKQIKVKEYEKQIDKIVYKLYGLTPEEIMIVEGNIKSSNH